MNIEPKHSNINEDFSLPRKSLFKISKSQPDKANPATFPITRKMKFIDFDKCVDVLESRGWKSLSGRGMPSTVDTIMFSGDNIIPVEIKGRSKDTPASVNVIKSTNRSLAKKLATFVANIYMVNKRFITDFWIMTSYNSADSIGVNINEQVCNIIKACEWVIDKGELIKSIKKIRVREIKDFEVNSLELNGFNKSPKWFVNEYESAIANDDALFLLNE